MKFPVLVVRGGDSNVLLQEPAARFAAALPEGRLVTVPDCGHNVHSQNTLGFLDAIAPILDALQDRETERACDAHCDCSTPPMSTSGKEAGPTCDCAACAASSMWPSIAAWTRS